jgi:hypothetical protein
MLAMKQEIIELEEEIRLAQLSQNVEFFEEILSDDFQFVTPQGKIVTKHEDIAQYKSGHLKMTAVEVSEQSVNVYGSSAVVRFKVKFEGQAGEYSFSTSMYITRFYSKHTGTWKMVAGHSSEIK